MLRPKEGLEIDGFHLGKMLHEGGFATIWEVTHPDHTQPMLMKCPKILDGYDGPTIVGFEIELMIMPRLTGPHVPAVFGVGDFDRMPYIVMERLPGKSLLDVFTRKPRPLSEVLELAARMTEAVHALHRQGVVHLDLKPENFMIRETGEAVCIDFGLSRHDRLPDLLAEEFQIPMGTFPYIAPEQVSGTRDDLRADIFALGALIYELATGQFPFGKPETIAGVRKRLWRDPVPPRAIDRNLPEWLQEIILRAVEVRPLKRYQSAAQLLFDLTHPAQVTLTSRAHKTRQDGIWAVFRRWRARRKLERFGPAPLLSEQISRAPVLMVAVDTSPNMEMLSDALLGSVKRLLRLEPDARVACVNVIRTARLAIDQTTTADGENLHVARLVALKAWAESLELGDERLTFTVLEGSDPARALIDHAATLQAEHILMGARAHSATRRFLGSVSAQVVAEAHCSVTVIRLPSGSEA
jgi:serine/threonine protein kinase